MLLNWCRLSWGTIPEPSVSVGGGRWEVGGRGEEEGGGRGKTGGRGGGGGGGGKEGREGFREYKGMASCDSHMYKWFHCVF